MNYHKFLDGSTRAAYIKMDDFEKTKSNGGVVCGFTTVEAARLQGYLNKNFNGIMAIPCSIEVKDGWIYDGEKIVDSNYSSNT
jgi:hypothetical protein